MIKYFLTLIFANLTRIYANLLWKISAVIRAKSAEIRVSIVILIIFFIGVPALTQAFPNEPNGYADINWGKSFWELKDIALFQEGGDYKYGYRQDEPYRRGLIEIERIVYCFYQDKFFAVYIETKGFGNAELLRRDLIYNCGPWTGSRRKFELYWQGEMTEIAYRLDPVSEVCRVAIMSKEILDRIASIKKAWPMERR